MISIHCNLISIHCNLISMPRLLHAATVHAYHYHTADYFRRRTGWLIGGGARNMSARMKALYFGMPSQPFFCRKQNWCLIHLSSIIGCTRKNRCLFLWRVWSTLIPPLSLSPTFMQMAQHRNCQPKLPNCPVKVAASKVRLDVL